MGPRSLDRGNIHHIRDDCKCKRHSSMGPRSLDRGNAAKALYKRLSEILQWGRDLSIAEMIRPRRNTVGWGVFNGAAISRSRKSILSRERVAGAGFLQWGRDLSIAEMERKHASFAVDRISSMGPRSLDRGNRVTCGR